MDWAYISSHVHLEAKVALVVWCTWHRQTPLPYLVVLTAPLGVAPLVHERLPGVHVRNAPTGSNLHDNK